jgi:predicted dienelactone hydrolase
MSEETVLTDVYPENIEINDSILPDETAFPDLIQDVQTDEISIVKPDPAQWGPYQVGMTSFQLFDMKRLRLVPTTVWYPAIPQGQSKAKYLLIIEGNAYNEAPHDTKGAPYPLILFSHGFKGLAVQSVSYTEFLASQGYVVAAMDHQGNTLTDFFSDDKKVAEVAIERPVDVKFVYDEMLKLNAGGSILLKGMIDTTRVAVTGHSFGGYTAIMVAGGEVNVSDAQKACASGAPSDIFCDYVGYWPSGEIVKLDPGIPSLKAAAYLAPGGYSAFGDDGLSKVKVPSMIFGGTLDTTCSVSVEIDPIYNALPQPKYKAILENASHMSFANICDLPLAQQIIKDYCNVPGMLDPDKAFSAVNALATAFFNFYVKGDSYYKDFLTESYVKDKIGFVQWTMSAP